MVFLGPTDAAGSSLEVAEEPKDEQVAGLLARSGSRGLGISSVFPRKTLGSR